MPRAARKTAPDLPYKAHPQPVQAPTGLPYGEHQGATEAQKALPIAGQAVDLAAVFHSPTAPDAVAPTQGGAPPAQANAQDANAQHVEALSQFANGLVPIGLTGASNRPGEPVTAGLSSGAGAGPEGLTLPGGSTAATLYALAQASDDPIFWDLAEQAARNGQ